MPRTKPVPLKELPADLAAAIDRGRANRMLSSTIPVQIWAHRPKVASAWLQTIEAMHVHGCLDERLRELVRMKIASITRCEACLIARKSDSVSEEDLACASSDDPRFTPQERAALHYAELFASDYFSIDENTYAGLEQQFTTEQIVELNMFCALMLAGGRMTYVQRGYES